mgnify:CR=1 FL=1
MVAQACNPSYLEAEVGKSLAEEIETARRERAIWDLRQRIAGLRWQRCPARVDDGRVSWDPQIVQGLKQQSLAVVDYLRTRSASARS